MLSYIEISKENALNNVGLFRKLVAPKTKIAAVIKANAYGHGVREMAQILEDAVDYFQVDDFAELAELRQYTSKPVLVLGYVAKEELQGAAELDGILAVYDRETLLALDEIGRQLSRCLKVHIKIDAFLGRQGLLGDGVSGFIEDLKKTTMIEVDGVYSHFANIEDTTDFSHARKQLETYDKALDLFRKAGYSQAKRHISASSGILVYERQNGYSDIVRLGLSMYGMWPSEELRLKYENDDFRLLPVMRWVTHVAQVKTLPTGHTIGYGLTYVTEKPTKVAVIPQGYSDGYDRGLSGRGEVLIRCERCPVLGRVAMNMFVVDVSHLDDVHTEDEVVLLGVQGEEKITAEEIAEKLGTINYEITTRVWPKLARVIR